jgi:hypothetical protein
MYRHLEEEKKIERKTPFPVKRQHSNGKSKVGGGDVRMEK